MEEPKFYTETKDLIFLLIKAQDLADAIGKVELGTQFYAVRSKLQRELKANLAKK